MTTSKCSEKKGRGIMARETDIGSLLAGLHGLNYVLEPKTVAVIGASRQQGSVGYSILQNLLRGNFTGVVYPVNPHARAICGVRAYPSVADVPEAVDLAVIALPASTVPDVMQQCGAKGVRDTIVVSAGFKETGVEGARLEMQMKAVAKAHGIGIVGPNCLGVINTDAGVLLNASFAKEMPQPGNIAFISQSGALCTAVLDYAKGQGIGFSKVVSLGNKSDINANDFLAYLWHDPLTEVILLYLEDIIEGWTFLRLARDITGEGPHHKPILALKSGRTKAGARAAASHTGSLSGSDEMYETIFTQSGVIRVDTVGNLFDYAMAFSSQPLPRGRRAAIITNAGGPGIMATDACVRYGLDMARLDEGTVKTLREKLPPSAAVQNPVDLIGDARHDRYEHALGTVLHDPMVDGVIVLLTPQAMTDIEQTATVISELAKRGDKPVLCSFIGTADVATGSRILRDQGVPCYTFPEDAVRALATMNQYREWVARPRTDVRTFEADSERACVLLTEAKKSGDGFIPGDAAFQVLESYGFPLLPWGMGRTADDAVAHADRIGYPVALKLLSPDVIHKFDIGGVQLSLETPGDVRRAFDDMMDSVKRHQPQAAVDGVLVQRMAKRGREVIIGMKRDPQFGPLIMFGLGGIYVETLRDVTFRLAPVRELGTYRMIEGIRSHRLLDGVRGEPSADVDAIAECIMRLSQLCIEQDAIDELDINPLIVYPRGEGAFVADARISMRDID